MRIGTVVKASRRQIGIQVVFDGDVRPVAYRHDDVINGADDMTDMLDGRGVKVGMRVESLPEHRLRLTGEAFAAEADPDPGPPDRGLDSPEKFIGWAKSLGAAGRLDAWIAANSGARMPFDPDDLDELLNK